MAAIAGDRAGGLKFPSARKDPAIRFPGNLAEMSKTPIGEDVRLGGRLCAGWWAAIRRLVSGTAGLQ